MSKYLDLWYKIVLGKHNKKQKNSTKYFILFFLICSLPGLYIYIISF